MTTNLRLSGYPGNFIVRAGGSGLPQDSVVNLTQLMTTDRTNLTDHVGSLTGAQMRRLDDGLRLVLEL